MAETLHYPIIYLFGGMGLFLLGMQLCSENLQKMAANKVREVLGRLSDRPFMAIVIGVVLTILLQSSGAVTTMLVSLGSANIITLPRVMGVIVGAAIGSTFTVQLMSFHIARFGITIFFVAFAIYFLSRKRQLKNFFGAVMGLGLIFWSLEMMSFGSQSLKNNPHFTELFLQMNEAPLLAIAVTAVFSGFVQSSAVVIGLAMALADSHVITLTDALYWVYGANIGTTFTAMIGALGSNWIGRQIAWAHLFFKVGSVALFFPVTELFVNFLNHMDGTIARQIANAHTFYNLAAALVFFPFMQWGAKIIEKLFPPEDDESEFAPQFISTDPGQDGILRYERAKRETLRLGEMVLGMVEESILLFKGQDLDLEESIHIRDNKVDLLNREIKMFLIKSSQWNSRTVKSPEAQELSERSYQLISFVTDLEAIGDLVEKTLMPLATKKQNLKLDFSIKGWEELCLFHQEVVEFMSLSISCFHLANSELAERVIKKKREIQELESKLRALHYDRLHVGAAQTVNTSSIHLEMLSNYRRIVGLMSNYAYTLRKG